MSDSDDTRTSGQRIADDFLLGYSDLRLRLIVAIDTDADIHYQRGWDDAVEAAARVVNNALVDGAELRTIRERVRTLKGITP